MSATTGLPSTDPDAADSVRSHLAQVRDQLMGGRGVGADPAEIARHTRDRRRIGGHEVTEGLAATGRQTARARGEIPALVAAVAESRAELAVAVRVLVEAYGPERMLLRLRCRGRETAARMVGRGAAELERSPTVRAWVGAALAVGAWLAIAVWRRRAARNRCRR